MSKQTDFDVILLGSGLGSLLCANLLSKEGFRVAVYEKHFQLGGNLQDFKRKNCSFETGMHYIGCLNKDQILYKYFNYLNIIDKINVQALDKESYDIINIGENEYKFSNSYEGFTSALKTYFPKEEKAIDCYVDKLKEIWYSSNLLNLKEIDFSELISGNPEHQVNAYKYINSLTDDKELRAVLAGNNGLYAGDKDKTPLYILANINSFFIHSAWRI